MAANYEDADTNLAGSEKLVGKVNYLPLGAVVDCSFLGSVFSVVGGTAMGGVTASTGF